MLALVRGPLRGSGIIRQIEKDSGTLMSLATVIGALDRLLVQGWVEAAGHHAENGRRGRFALSEQGRAALVSQVGRTAGAPRVARERGVVIRDSG
jgi:DNA-binding PadR family transcriptional regulator